MQFLPYVYTGRLVKRSGGGVTISTVFKTDSTHTPLPMETESDKHGTLAVGYSLLSVEVVNLQLYPQEVKDHGPH